MIEEPVIPNLDECLIGTPGRQTIGQGVMLNRRGLRPTNADNHKGVGHGFSKATMTQRRPGPPLSLSPTAVQGVQLLSIIDPDEPPRPVGLDQIDEFINSCTADLFQLWLVRDLQIPKDALP